MGLVLNKIKGFREAVEAERLKQSRIRESAWQNLTHDILGVRIRTMTVRDFVLLDHYGSPFVNRQIPEFCDLAFFLWLLSPQCDRWNRRRWQFGRRLHAFLFSRMVKRRFHRNIVEGHENKICFQSAIVRCFEYVDHMFMDAPPALGKSKGIGNAGCYLASWFDLMQSEYLMTEAEVWDMPLPQLFQRVQEIRTRNGAKGPSFNLYEDRIKKRIQDGLCSGKYTFESLAKNGIDYTQN